MNLTDVRAIVDSMFNEQGIRRLDDGRELLTGSLFTFPMEHRYYGRTLLQLYAGIGDIGGELWEQNARTLLRLASLRHDALPEMLDGGHAANDGVAYVLTTLAKFSMNESDADEFMASQPVEALRQLRSLADGLGRMHARGMLHRNVWAGAIELAGEPDASGKGLRLRLARFEMSTMLSNVLRQVATRPEIALGIRTLYREQGPAFLAACPRERLAQLYPRFEEDPFDDAHSDVYGLGAVAARWFVPAIDMSGWNAVARGPDLDVSLLRVLHNQRREAVRRARLPPLLAEILTKMLEDKRANRPTASEVADDLGRHLEEFHAWFEPEKVARRHLVSVSAPDFTQSALRDDGAIEHAPTDPVGRDELLAYIRRDLHGGRLVVSPEGYTPWFRSSTNPDAVKSRYVLIGKNYCYFASPFERRVGAFRPKDVLVYESLQLRYVLNRHSRNVKVLEEYPTAEPLPPVDVVPKESARLDEEELAKTETPSWKPLLDAVDGGRPPPPWRRDMGQALEWIVDVGQARLDVRVYPIDATPQGARTLLRSDKERSDAWLRRNSLRRECAGVGNGRPPLADFLEGSAGSSEVVLRPDVRGEPSREREVRAYLLEREGENAVWVDTRGSEVTGAYWLFAAMDLAQQDVVGRQRAAVDELMQNTQLCEQLNAPHALVKVRDEWVEAGKGLRGNAPAVVKDMLECWPLYAIHGPPGTGKTTVAAHAVKAALRADRSRRILVSAQAHDSLDNLAERILKLLASEEQGDRLDVVGVRVASAGTDDRVSPDMRRHLPASLATARARVINAHCIQRLQAGEPDARLRRILERLRDLGEEMVPELVDRIQRGANLVFATCASSTQRNVGGGGDEGLYDWVIVEEAAKAWPTELALPLVRGNQWTLLGDHFQIGSFGKREMEELLTRCAIAPDTLLKERVSNRDGILRYFDLFANLFEPSNVTTGLERSAVGRLNRQFRMCEPIAELVGRVFYNGALETDEERREQPHGLQGPGAIAGHSLMWVDTPEDARDAPRWQNPREADIVASLVAALAPAPPTDREDALAILSPYWDQIRALRKRLPHRTEQIHTIDSFQGKEADVVVLSLVRNNARESHTSRLGHLADAERVNVALSRARKLLLIVGHFDHFAETPDTVRDGKVRLHPWRAVCAEFPKLEKQFPGRVARLGSAFVLARRGPTE